MHKNSSHKRSGSGRITLSKVAKIAGVSTMTVSRCLNTPDKVSESVRERVMKAVQNTGYVPNQLAGSLASSRTDAIGLILPTLRTSLYSRMLEHFQKQCAALGLQCIVASDNHDANEREKLVRTFLGWQVKGLFLIGLEHSKHIHEMIKQTNTFCVTMSDTDLDTLHPDGYTGFPYVVGYSHYHGGYDMGKRLARAGYKRIGYLDNTDKSTDARGENRLLGFMAGVGENGGKFTKHMVIDGASIVSDGARSIEKINIDDHDAIMFSADDLAVGAVLAWQKNGVKIPEDIAVAGFHGTDTGSYLSPPLSTIATPRGDMVKLCMELFEKHLNGEITQEKVHQLPFYFREGRSF